jgi:Protein of unknown function (DUF1360)
MSTFDGKPVDARDYAALNAAWLSLLGAVLIAARDRGHDPVPAPEIVPLGVATFTLAKLLAKERVAAEVREPFVEETAEGRRPKGEGLRYAVGEMLTCTRCVGFWAAVGVVGLRVLRPREGQVVTAVLGASAVNDVAQAGFSWLTATTTAAERAAAEPIAGAVGEPAHQRYETARAPSAAGG